MKGGGAKGGGVTVTSKVTMRLPVASQPPTRATTLTVGQGCWQWSTPVKCAAHVGSVAQAASTVTGPPQVHPSGPSFPNSTVQLPVASTTAMALAPAPEQLNPTVTATTDLGPVVMGPQSVAVPVTVISVGEVPLAGITPTTESIVIRHAIAGLAPSETRLHLAH